MPAAPGLFSAGDDDDDDEICTGDTVLTRADPTVDCAQYETSPLPRTTRCRMCART
jgi:hypothetical protein